MAESNGTRPRSIAMDDELWDTLRAAVNKHNFVRGSNITASEIVRRGAEALALDVVLVQGEQWTADQVAYSSTGHAPSVHAARKVFAFFHDGTPGTTKRAQQDIAILANLIADAYWNHNNGEQG